MIDDINRLDGTFGTKREEAESKLKIARENYYAALNNFEVLKKHLLHFIFTINMFKSKCYVF